MILEIKNFGKVCGDSFHCGMRDLVDCVGISKGGVYCTEDE